MKKRKKASHNKKITYLLLVMAIILLIGSAIGSTSAALVIQSENYVAEIKVSQIGVSLWENGEVVTRRDYNNKKRDWDTTSGELLAKMLGKDEKLILNKEYKEELYVENSGKIDEYVRVRVYKYWTKKDSEDKETRLSPDLIKLNFLDDGRWLILDKDVEGKECTELYYKGILKAGDETELFADKIAIDSKLAAEAKVEQRYDEKQNKTIITTTYKYDGVEFHLDVEVDAVQTHNAQEAIKSAWGVDANALGILEGE